MSSASAAAGPSTEPTPASTLLLQISTPSTATTNINNNNNMPYPTPPPADPPTQAVAAPTSTANQYDMGTDGPDGLHLSTIIPIFVVVFFAFLFFFGFTSWLIRRRRRMRYERGMSARDLLIVASMRPSPSGGAGGGERRKKKRRMEKPKLWEVDVKGVHLDRDLEKAYPVAVELEAEPKNPPRPPNPLIPKFMRPDPPKREAQVTFLLSMPSPYRRPDEPSREYVIATTSLPYRPPLDEDDREEDLTLEKAALEKIYRRSGIPQ